METLSEPIPAPRPPSEKDSNLSKITNCVVGMDVKSPEPRLPARGTAESTWLPRSQRKPKGNI